MFYLFVGAIAAYAVYQSFFADNRDHRSRGRSQSRESSRRCDERQSIDSSQGDYPVVEGYGSLRARAKQEGNLMAQCYRQSQEAYERRDRARAKTLSDEGKRHALEMEKLNAKASAIIFKENNPNRDICQVDLHGLYVKEAIAYSERALREARQRGDSEIRFIVGQGTHSDRGISRLKPAIQEALRARGLHAEVDPKNLGVLLVHLSGR